MITSNKALQLILNQTENFGSEQIDFKNSIGRILKEDIVADRDFPPFNRASMDGIAITVDPFNKGVRDFKIEGVQAAGSPQLTLKNPNNCIEVMTGAMAPVNSEAIIPYELLEIKDGIAKVNTNDIKYFQNIHRTG